MTLQLRSSLQNYFPLILELFENLESDPVTSLLQRWPSLLKTFLKRMASAGCPRHRFGCLGCGATRGLTDYRWAGVSR